LIGVILIPAGTGLHAKGVADRWYFAGSLGYVATRDTIANNAGEPFDPRPAHFESRETDVHDGPALAFQLGFGLTRSFSIQLDAAYFQGEVGPIDVYLQDQFPIAANPLNPTVLNLMHSRERTIPVSAGELTQIPIGLSAVLRFRTDRTFNPYIGGGGGRIYARMDHDGDVTDLNARLGRLRILSLHDEHHAIITPDVPGLVAAEARVPWVYPVSVEVDDAWEGHIMAGLEWSASDRLSIVAEARYTFTGQSVMIDLEGQDQVNASIFSEKLFRKDGSVALFNQVPMAPNPFVDNNPALGHVGCILTSTGDFDGDGHLGDLCYPQTFEPQGIFLVQGGELNLSQTTLSVGLRVYF
jgi:hypothetical protein